MADFLPPVVGRLLGDVTDFTSKMGQARSAYGETAADAEARSAAMTQAVGRGLVVAGGVATGVGAVLTKMGDDSKRAESQLRTAIENAGGSMDELGPRIGKVSDRLIKLGVDDEATARALATLTTATQDPSAALDRMGLVADIAAARHISLESAADKVAKGLNGNTRIFKEFGIELGLNATAQEREAAMAELGARVHGQAAAQADNFSTKMESLKIRAENVAEAVGQKVGPALAVAGPLMAGVGGIVQSGLVPALISGVASAWSFAAGMVGAGVSAAAAAIPVIVAWAPVILTIAAIGVAAYLLYDNWSVVWGFIKDVAGAAADWITGHLDLIASAIFLPFAPLILLVTHWDEAWSFVKDITAAAWSWLVDTISGGIETVVGFYLSLPGRAASAMSGLGGAIVDVAAGALSWLWDTVSGGVSDAVGLVAGLPGRAADALGNLGGYLWDAGYALIDGFRRGIVSAAEAVFNYVRGIAGRIASLKGPLDYDKRLLVPAGNAIMDGLVRGLRDHETYLVSQLARVTGMIEGVGGDVSVTGSAVPTGASAVRGGAGGGRVVNVTLQINTTTGSIPDETMRKIRAQLFEMENDLPPGSIVPPA